METRERSAAMGLWQMDIVGGFPLADGASAKALTGIDDHSRMCTGAHLMTRERAELIYGPIRSGPWKTAEDVYWPP